MSGFATEPLTDDNIQEAVNLWISRTGYDEDEPEPRRTAEERRAEAERIYGHISQWDVSRVTDMNSLFKEETIQKKNTKNSQKINYYIIFNMII